MKILFIADGRSPIALNWIDYFVTHNHEVSLASTYPFTTNINLNSTFVIPVAFAKAAGTTTSGRTTQKSSQKFNPLGKFTSPQIRAKIRHWIGPITIPKAAENLAKIIENIQPDIIHAMRIPFEGMAAAQAINQLERKNAPTPPLIISVWGNDFTLHADSSPQMSYYTKLALKKTHGLHTDCQRDFRLAIRWGFAKHKPAIVLPGNGGVKTNIFYPPPERQEQPPIIINPRGIRAYVRNDTFFQAIPEILAAIPETQFICPAMSGETEANYWIKKLNIGHAIKLLPKVHHQDMANYYRASHIMVSPSTHDGTPNTLLEAMVCGCFPIAGNVESITEWIKDGENGFLINPADPHALAWAVLRALNNIKLRNRAKEVNWKIIQDRGEYQNSMLSALQFYQSLI